MDFFTSKDIQHFHYICKLNLIHLLKSWKIFKQSKKHLAKLEVYIRNTPLQHRFPWRRRGCKHLLSYNMHSRSWPSFFWIVTLPLLCFTTEPWRGQHRTVDSSPDCLQFFGGGGVLEAGILGSLDQRRAQREGTGRDRRGKGRRRSRGGEALAGVIHLSFARRKAGIQLV